MIQDIKMALDQAKDRMVAADAKLREVELNIAGARQALRDVGVLAERSGTGADAAAEPLIVQANNHLREARAAVDQLKGELTTVLQK